MATSINSYSVKLSMDASGFVDSTKVSRSEARALIKDIEAAQSPFEKYAVEQDRLKRALDSGAISQGTYNRLLRDKKPGIADVTAALGPYGVAIGAVTVGITAAAAATVAFISAMRDQQNAIDETADKAQRLGVSFSDLKGLEFGFKEGAGIDAQTVGDSIKKLQINMAKAVEGDEGLRAAFTKLGLDAGDLIGQGPREAMMQIADAMAGVDNHAERLKLSMEIFGKSGADLASTLGQGRDALESSAAFAEKWLGLTDAQVAAVGANNDSWDRIGIIVEGISQTVAAELAPVFKTVADTILESAGGFDGLSKAVKDAVTTGTILVGLFMDALDPVIEIANRLHAIHTLDFEAATKSLDMEKVFGPDKAMALFKQLEANRNEAAASAAEAERKRQEARHAMAMQDTEKETSAKEAAAKKIADEEERLRKAAEREQRKMAEDALKNAEKYFEDERKRQMKLREDVAKGPGAGMEAGSAEAARFMAEQANQAIAEATVGVDAKPTDEQLVEQAKIQVEIARAAKVKQDEMVSKLQGVTDAIKDNGWEAV